MDPTTHDQGGPSNRAAVAPDNISSDNPSSSSSLPHLSLPAISLPKGGGAIRGTNEKFSMNASIGTGVLSIPIDASPSRSGFHPELSLNYSSNDGNGPFGLGWSLNLGSISRKTSKGLPRYDDANDSDVFILSGAEDLVPLFKKNPLGEFVRDQSGDFLPDDSPRDGFIIRRYALRVESAFTRIERWTSQGDGSVHWRNITGENITSIYGSTENSRISDPETGEIFSWLICQTYDDKGNAMIYHYKSEDSQNVSLDQASEANRTITSRAVNRYPKSIKYGNRKPNRDANWKATNPSIIPIEDWMFEVLFDYGEHNLLAPSTAEQSIWPCRQDPFSTRRSGFDIRTYRLCRRVLMFHHFIEELGVQDYLVRSLDIDYNENQVASLAGSFTSCGYVLQPGGYLKKFVPPVELAYTEAPDPKMVPELSLVDIDTRSLENLPCGVGEGNYTWVDLDGEGLPGVLARDGNAWFYKRNTSANNLIKKNDIKIAMAQLSDLTQVSTHPGTGMSGTELHLEDLAGNGILDAVDFNGPAPGFWRRTENGRWQSFRSFESMPSVSTNDPNTRLIDLTGDGLPDILITDSDAFTWYPGLGELGYGPPQWLHQGLDEEKCPRLVFSDPKLSVYLADMTGDGLTDLVRIQNSDVCYWPNIGYGRFGCKVALDNTVSFDTDDIFHPKRIHLADIDGSGTSDVLYVGSEGIDIYYNQSGNSLNDRIRLDSLSGCDLNSSSIAVMDLLGNGTSCLVISSKLPSDTRHSIRYIDLTDGQKPHLLVKVVNNMGSDIRIRYAPSTRFYLQDKERGVEWITRLAFPVQCVERVETYDWISKTRSVTRYAYHDGFYDCVEREFRGFAMVEQWDTEELDLLSSKEDTLFSDAPPDVLDAASYIPPIHTKSWYHTGAFFNATKRSRHLAKDYYSLGSRADLDDSVFAQESEMSGEDLREAYRSLKGAVLRSEVYTADSNVLSPSIPRLITEHNYTVNLIQPHGDNLFAVFLTHGRETLTYHSENSPDDGRLEHSMTLQTDKFGNVLKSLSITNGRQPGKSQLPDPRDRTTQESHHVTFTESTVTTVVDEDDDYRLPASCEVLTWEITGLNPIAQAEKFSLSTFTDDNFRILNSLTEIPYQEKSKPGLKRRRLIANSRILYRSDDLTQILPGGKLGALGLPAETYRLALTSDLVSGIFRRQPPSQPAEHLLPDLQNTLESPHLGAYVDLDKNGYWWAPSGRLYFHEDPSSAPAQELSEARSHFFLTRSQRDQFGNTATLKYDDFDLLPVLAVDALKNTLSSTNDYRVLQPSTLTNANGSRTRNAYDALGLVAGSAVMSAQNLGDNLDNFVTDLEQDVIDQFMNLPRGPLGATLLGNATSRNVYDPLRYWRETKSTQSPNGNRPSFAALLHRHHHVSDVDEPLIIQVSFAFSDGFGRVVQKKSQAEPGPVGSKQLVDPRWTTTGWTLFNNKGNPVKKYEPFFDGTHEFLPANKIGVCSTIMYDSESRIVATVHPNHTWEKTIFDPWESIEYDVNDTVGQSDPRNDPDVGAYFKRMPTVDFLPSWADARLNGQLGSEEKNAATKAMAHADTPSITHFDSLGRVFLKIADNGTLGKYTIRTIMDIDGNHLQTIDNQGRIVTNVNYNMLGKALNYVGAENGERWVFHDSAGRQLFSWDGRNHRFSSQYDQLGRLTHYSFSEGGGPEVTVSRKVYGESLPNPEASNHRGQIYQSYDQAGIATNISYDFKGNVTQSQRQLWTTYKSPIDVSSAPELEHPIYSTVSTWDAYSRQKVVTNPDGSQFQRTYNDAGLLETVMAKVLDTSGGVQAAWTSFITNIDYDALGQRTVVQYGNGTTCSSTYDPLTYRLSRQQLTATGRVFQDLNYTYDPVGNVTTLRDNAQQTLYFRNTVVDPGVDYTYDAIYRLIAISGREHLGQTNGKPNAPSAPSGINDLQNQQLQPGDGNAMGRYIEQFVYDKVGNIQSMKHIGSDPKNPGWTRSYAYNESSVLGGSKPSNRLSSSTVSSNTEQYAYDPHGNMTKMPQLSLIQWDYKDQLQATSKQVVSNGGTPETTFYIYDDSGQRVRKVTERAAVAGQDATQMKERIYLGELYEVYREFSAPPPGSSSNTTTSPDITLERNSFHILDDKNRFCMVETRKIGTDQAPVQLIRYTYGNNIGSVSLELSDMAQLISYEEYFAYGGTSYQAVQSQTDTAKRYRYTGKERDEENGLYYHGARYYACWLGRWTACDPSGYMDGLNIYQYVRSNPVSLRDPDGRFPQDPRAVQGYFQSAVNTANNFVDHVKETALGLKDSGVEIGEGLLLMEVAPPIAIGLIAKDMHDTYNEWKKIDGPVTGVIMAVNQLNPLYHALTNGYEADKAFSEGQYREGGRRVGHTAAAIVGTVAMVEGGAGLVESIAEVESKTISKTISESQAAKQSEVGQSPPKTSTPHPEPTQSLPQEPPPISTPETPPPPTQTPVAEAPKSSPAAPEGTATPAATPKPTPTPKAAKAPKKQKMGKAEKLRQDRGFDVGAGDIIPIKRPGGDQTAPHDSRGITDSMRKQAQLNGEKWTQKGRKYDVAHRNPHEYTAPGEQVRFGSQDRTINRSEGKAISKAGKARQKAGMYTRKSDPTKPK